MRLPSGAWRWCDCSLCDAGADKDKANRCGATALIHASVGGYLQVAQLLCEAGSSGSGSGSGSGLESGSGSDGENENGATA